MNPQCTMQDISEALAEYQQRFPDERVIVARFLELLSLDAAALDRQCFTPGHLTSSCWLLNPERDAVLLTHHKKLNRWLQLGGHVDGDANLLRSSLREAEEESGIEGIQALTSQIIDIDIHEIPARKSDLAHYHFDCRFLLVAPTSGYAVSEESHDLRWIPLTEIATFISEKSILRLAAKADAFLAVS